MPSPCDMSPKTVHEPTAILEALLFLSGEPLSLDDICAHTGWTAEMTIKTANTLEGLLQDQRRGIMVISVAGGYQLATRPELFNQVQWVHKTTTELSPMALEVLAIVAFKQPVTRADIEKIRGVSSDRLITNLLQQELIKELGRKDSPGRPILYGTSAYFLECIGMDSLAELAEKIPHTAIDHSVDAVDTTEEENHEGTVAEGHE